MGRPNSPGQEVAVQSDTVPSDAGESRSSPQQLRAELARAGESQLLPAHRTRHMPVTHRRRDVS